MGNTVGKIIDAYTAPKTKEGPKLPNVTLLFDGRCLDNGYEILHLEHNTYGMIASDTKGNTSDAAQTCSGTGVMTKDEQYQSMFCMMECVPQDPSHTAPDSESMQADQVDKNEDFQHHLESLAIVEEEYHKLRKEGKAIHLEILKFLGRVRNRKAMKDDVLEEAQRLISTGTAEHTAILKGKLARVKKLTDGIEEEVGAWFDEVAR